jgi:perosamine synthetase
MGLDALPEKSIGGCHIVAQRFIPVAAPMLVGNEKTYVMDCLDSTWISSSGKYIERFESGFAEFCGVKHALTCGNGTVALHLALLALGIGPGDEVIIPTLTYIATANAVAYCGATPVLVDSEKDTWNIDPSLIEEKITPRTKGIIVVHLYGQPADMDGIRTVADRHGLFVLEDAAEAHGAEYKGKKVGSLGDLATFSFYGNKIITTGEGGMIVTDDDKLAKTIRQLRSQGTDPERRYWFPVVGYNYRMTNIAAAIGVAQLEKVDWHVQRRLEVAEEYQNQLRRIPGVDWHREMSWAKHVYWMFTALLDADSELGRDEVMSELLKRGVETRPVFYPMHVLPPYVQMGSGQQFPVADDISRRAFNLPTWAGLNSEDVKYICDNLSKIVAKKQDFAATEVCK